MYSANNEYQQYCNAHIKIQTSDDFHYRNLKQVRLWSFLNELAWCLVFLYSMCLYIVAKDLLNGILILIPIVMLAVITAARMTIHYKNDDRDILRKIVPALLEMLFYLFLCSNSF